MSSVATNVVTNYEITTQSQRDHTIIQSPGVGEGVGEGVGDSVGCGVGAKNHSKYNSVRSVRTIIMTNHIITTQSQHNHNTITTQSHQSYNHTIIH